MSTFEIAFLIALPTIIALAIMAIIAFIAGAVRRYRAMRRH